MKLKIKGDVEMARVRAASAVLESLTSGMNAENARFAYDGLRPYFLARDFQAARENFQAEVADMEETSDG